MPHHMPAPSRSHKIYRDRALGRWQRRGPPLGSPEPRRRQGPAAVGPHGRQGAPVPRHAGRGPRLRAPGPRGARPRALGGTPLTHPRPPRRGMAPPQAPAGRRTTAPGRPRRPALEPPPRLQTRAQPSRDARDHRPLDRGALEGAPPGAHPPRLPAGEPVSQPRAVSLLVAPGDARLVVHAPGHPRGLPGCRWPPPTRGPVWWPRLRCRSPGPPPADVCSLPRREDGPPRNPFAYLRISG
jgi:hypothetical protein